MKVLYVVCSVGLGHMMRSLPIMRELLRRGCKLVLYTGSRALEIAKKEFEAYGDQVKFYEGSPYAGTLLGSPLKTAVGVVKRLKEILRIFREEEFRLKEVIEAEKPDLIISDERPDIPTEGIDAYLLTHSLTLPRISGPFEAVSVALEYVISEMQDKFKAVLVPDFPDGEISPFGKSTRPCSFTDVNRVKYVGILSDYAPMEVEEDIDVLLVASGPEPNRTRYERKVFPQLLRMAKEMPHKKFVVFRGRPEEKSYEKPLPNLEVYSFVSDKRKREEIMNRARIIVARAGGTMIADIMNLGKRALLVPSPDQWEQVVSAAHVRNVGLFYAEAQSKVNLKRDLKIAEGYPPVEELRGVARMSVRNFVRVVFEGSDPEFSGISFEEIKRRREHLRDNVPFTYFAGFGLRKRRSEKNGV